MIRPATPEDIPAIARLIRALAEYEKLLDAAVATDDQLREHLFGPTPAAEVLMAEADNRAVGFALYFRTFSTFVGKPGLYLEDLFVEPEYRGRGFGKALLAALARIAVSRGYGRLEWAVLDWNAPSIRFYESLGAKPNSEWTTYRLAGDTLTKLAAGR